MYNGGFVVVCEMIEFEFECGVNELFFIEVMVYFEFDLVILCDVLGWCIV